MIRPALFLAGKDLRQAFAGGQGPIQAVLLGLLLVFLFSLSASPGERFSLQQGVTIFWLSSAFSVVLIVSMLFHFEEANDVATALLLAPLPPQALWLGKFLSSLTLLLFCQIFFLPAILIFLDLSLAQSTGFFFPGLLGVNVGLCILGSLLGALGHGSGGRDALLAIVLFPLQIPLLLAGIRVGGTAIDGHAEMLTEWFGLIVAFDAIFAGAALVLFGYIFRGE